MDEITRMRLEIKDIANNTTTRLPLMLCIDASFSMIKRIKSINEGIRVLLKELTEDIYAVDSVEICIVAFGGSGAQVITPFALTKKVQYSDIRPSGATPLGEAVTYALDRLDERLETYGELGIEHYKPWMIIISDGEATDDYKQAAQRTRALEEQNALKVFPISMGDEKTNIAEFSIDKKIYRLEDLKVEEFFAWLSKSMSKQSKSCSAADDFSDIESVLI